LPHLSIDAPPPITCSSSSHLGLGFLGTQRSLHSYSPFFIRSHLLYLLSRDRTLPLPVSLPRLPGLQLRQSWGPSLGPAVQSCLPRQQLVFLKTHKSGSSSVLNLLHRYGDRHGLRFALPARYQFGYPRLFQASRVKGYRPQGGGTQPSFHILCHHMRFNLKEVRGATGVGGAGKRCSQAHGQYHQGRGPRTWGSPSITSTSELDVVGHKGRISCYYLCRCPLSRGSWEPVSPLPSGVYSSLFP
jgi:hypothetical protein